MRENRILKSRVEHVTTRLNSVTLDEKLLRAELMTVKETKRDYALS